MEFKLAPTCYSFDFNDRIGKIYPDISLKDKKKSEKIYLETFLKNLNKNSMSSIEKNMDKINFGKLYEQKIIK